MYWPQSETILHIGGSSKDEREEVSTNEDRRRRRRRKKAFERLVQWELHGGGGGIRMLENQNAVL